MNEAITVLEPFSLVPPIGGLETWCLYEKRGSSLDSNKQGKMNIGYDPKAFSIIFAQDARVLDRCMNEVSSSDLNRKKQMHEKFMLS